MYILLTVAALIYMVRCTLDYKKSSCGEMKIQHCFCCFYCCRFQVNGYRGSADQTHAALIIMCVCTYVRAQEIYKRPSCSHCAGNPITNLESKGAERPPLIIRDIHTGNPLFVAPFCLFWARVGPRNIQLGSSHALVSFVNCGRSVLSLFGGWPTNFFDYFSFALGILH
jgi:hypothetical protein